jgi:hypothetical protein
VNQVSILNQAKLNRSRGCPQNQVPLVYNHSCCCQDIDNLSRNNLKGVNLTSVNLIRFSFTENTQELFLIFCLPSKQLPLKQD